MKRLRTFIVDVVARIPARLQTKLLVAFLAMVTLLILSGAVGLRLLSGVNQQTEELIKLQRKIAAYRQVQHDTTGQLYGVASALLSPEERVLEATLRQLTQFGYDLDRLQYVAQDEVELLARVRQEYDRFIQIVTRAVELARAGQVAKARELQLSEAGPLADRLERLTNQLVNLAETDMLAGIESSHESYRTSRIAVIAFAIASILLALGLGYIISSSVVGPVTEIEARLRRIAAGDFTQRVQVVNRDELGVLAANVNRTCEELGRLYRQLERSVAELRALGEVSQVVNSTLELEAVLGAIAAQAAELAEADAGAFYAYDESSQAFQFQASHRFDDEIRRILARRPMRLGEGAIGLAGQRREAAQIPDIDEGQSHALYEVIRPAGYRALLAVPLLREESLVGGLVLCRKTAGGFAPETVRLVQTLANQCVLAIQNATLFHELEQRRQELEVASRHKSQFLANMSHELRTPLNAILGFAELVQDGIYGELPAKVSGVLERVQANGRHLLGLINDVLDLSKIEAGQFKLSVAEYSVADLVQTVVSGTEVLAADKKLRLEVVMPAYLPRGRGDPQKLTQVLLNLVGNAIKFTEKGGVSIKVAAADSRFLLEVTDTGPGIPAAEQQRIFEEFQQVDSSSTRKEGGTGLGLAIARRIVEMHEGRIWVESEPGRGSRFCVQVPMRIGEVVAA